MDETHEESLPINQLCVGFVPVKQNFKKNQTQKKNKHSTLHFAFPNRDSNPGLIGESDVS